MGSLLWQVPLLPSTKATAVVASGEDLPNGVQTATVAAAASGQPRLAKGWDVLETEFAGLEGTVADKFQIADSNAVNSRICESRTDCFIRLGVGTRTKMKDWDKQDGSDSPEDDAISGSDSEGLGDW